MKVGPIASLTACLSLRYSEYGCETKISFAFFGRERSSYVKWPSIVSPRLTVVSGFDAAMVTDGRTRGVEGRTRGVEGERRPKRSRQLLMCQDSVIACTT